MNIAELRSALREHADQLDDIGLPQRAGAARRRGKTMRRQRIAINTGAIVLALPLVIAALLSVNPLGGVRVTEPADRSPENVVRTSFAGRTLIDSKVAEGTGELTLTVTTNGASQWAASCSGVGGAYTLHQRIGAWESKGPCLEDAPSDPPWGPRLDEGGTDLPHTHTMKIWITRTRDGQPASPAAAVLTIGAYGLPRSADIVAETPVYELEESEGVVWELARSAQSEPGARTYDATYDSGDQAVFLEILTAGPTDTPVDVRVDGILQAKGPGHLGADPCWLGSFPAGSHRVSLTIRGRAPAESVLGVVWRTPVE